MAVGRPTAERFEQVNRILDEYRAMAAPELANVENALHLSEPELLEYRGRTYPVEPISGIDALRLIQMGQEFEALSHSAGNNVRGLGEFVHAYNRLLREIGRLARPRGFWRRLLWHVRPNPFRRASYGEVRDILGFFGRYQTRSSVRYRGQPVDSSPRSISKN